MESSTPMAVDCPRCRTRLQYPPGQQKIQCGVCSQVFLIDAPRAHAPPPQQAGAPIAHVPPPQQAHNAPLYAPIPRSSGRKRAMIVGIDYVNTRSQLRGCINDANCMEYMLKSKFGFQDQDILKMTDTSPNPILRPTRANMLQGFQWLVSGLQSGDSLVFHFSGHGSQSRSYTEADGYDETLLPSDFSTSGQIIDDEINARLVRPLPNGVKLLAIVDACHSGTVLDIQYQYCGKDNTGRPHWKDHQNQRVYQGTSGGIAISISGCNDDELSSDTKALSGTVATGAMTYSFIQAIESGQAHTWDTLLAAMRHTIKSSEKKRPGSSHGDILSMLMGAAFAQHSGPARQVPQLSASTTIDTDSPFHI